MRVLRYLLSVVVVMGCCVGVAEAQISEADAKGCTGNAMSAPDAAIQQCTDLMQRQGLRKEAMQVLLKYRGIAYLFKFELDAALADLDEAIRLKNDDAEAYSKRAVVYFSKRDYDHAIQDFEQSLRLNLNDNGSSTYFLGESWSYKGDYTRAVQAYDRAIQLDPNYAEAFFSRGKAFDKLGNRARADQDFAQALRLNPKYPETLASDALALLKQGAAANNDVIIEKMSDALRMQPNYWLAFAARSSAYTSKGDYDRAIQDNMEWIRLSPGDPNPFYLRGINYLMKGDFGLAEEDLSAALKMRPNHALSLHFRGIARFCGQKFAEAQQDFAAAAKLNPGEPNLALYRFLAQLRAGQDGKADLAASVATLQLADTQRRVFQFFLGTLSETDFRTFLLGLDPANANEKAAKGEGVFFLAEATVARNDRDTARKLFLDAVKYLKKGDNSAIISRAELDLLGPAKQ